jgi:7-carboxy-7-deazaguanine synthase
MRIAEIYASIQGETQYAGIPCTLVRTTGCDLRCSYCDTTYAFSGGSEMSVEEVMAEVRRLGLPSVTVTGGEPMLQPEIATLAERLVAEGFQVAVETSGAHPVVHLPPTVIRIVDVKTPGSGEVARNRWDILDALRPQDAIKFVLSDEADYQWSAEVIRTRSLAGKAELLFSPVTGRLDPRDLVAWILRDRLPVRLNLQLHKYIWGAEVRGV